MIKRPLIRLPPDHAPYRHAFRNFRAIAEGHNQARAHKTYLLRTALDASLTTPSGIPYGWVGDNCPKASSVEYGGEEDCQGPAREQGYI